MSDKFDEKKKSDNVPEEMTEEAADIAIGKTEIADSAASVMEEGMHENIDVSGVSDSVEPTVRYAELEAITEDTSRKGIRKNVRFIIIALVALVLIAVGILCYNIRKAPYNYLGYVNVYDLTICQQAQMEGLSLEEFLQRCSLPEDMPPTTHEAAARYMIPTGLIAERSYGMSFEELKQKYSIPDTITGVSLRFRIIDMLSDKFNVGETITEDTPWGITVGEMTLGAYYSMYDIETIKKTYKLSDSVTSDTKYKEVQNKIDRMEKKLYKESMK